MDLSRIIELPLNFEQLSGVERFFILGTNRIALDLRLLLAGRFQNRFFGFFSNDTERGSLTREAESAYLVRPLAHFYDALGPGDYLFLAERNHGLERKLHAQGVRLGFPRSLVNCFGTYEAPVFDLFLRDHFDPGMPSGVALDIGANFGMTAAMISPYFSKVLAFEPNLKLFENVKRNATLPANIESHNLAFGAAVGECEFYDQNGVNGTLVPTEGCASYPVRVETVDNYCQTHNIVPRFIKIDAEGFDGDILFGAAATIESHRPVIFFENPAIGANAASRWPEPDSLEQLFDSLRRCYTLKAYPSLDQLVPHECLGQEFTAYSKTQTVPTLNIAAIPK